MAVRIRLKRTGCTNNDQWRFVVADAKMPRDGRFIEEIGYYNPIPKDEVIVIKNDRLEYWMSKGALPSVTVKSLIKRAKKKAKAS